MSGEKLSLLAFDVLYGKELGISEYMLFDHLKYYAQNARFKTPAHIKKSSVGEFYEKNMDTFCKLSEDLYRHLFEKVAKESAVFISSQMLPLGLLMGVETPDKEPPSPKSLFPIPVSARKLFDTWAYPVQEIRDLEYLKEAWPSRDTDLLDDYLNRTMVIEKISQSLCVGYTPNNSVPEVYALHNDSAFRKEYMIADILYPWVTQPLSQLRMLIPALDPSIRQRILETAIPLNKDSTFTCSIEGPRPVTRTLPGADGSHAYTFDCMTDFISYLTLRVKQSEYHPVIRRQFWTPFFGIANYDDLRTAVDDPELMGRVDKACLDSKRLYVEMLKTGLRYESQYAVLCGMAGRFTVQGSFSAILDLSVKNKHHETTSTPISSNIMEKMYKTLDIDW